jgi:hypothetical protein
MRILKLTSLVFNRETFGGRPAAIPIRKEPLDPIPVEDWRGSNLKVSPVAYPLSLTANDIVDLRVTAKFTATFTVTDPPPAGPIHIRASGAHDKLLGDVVSLPIAVADLGRVQGHEFCLTGVRLHQATIDAYTVAWQWEWSDDGRRWRPFGCSSHPVFVTVDQPKAPWGRECLGGEPHTIGPWEEAMSIACRWAKGLRRREPVLDAITAAIDQFAGTPIDCRVIRYDDLGSLCFGDKIFRIHKIPFILERHPNAPTKLNCQDLNTAIATYAAILGCAVRVIKFLPCGTEDDATFGTNPIKVFGDRSSAPTRFKYHEVAAKDGRPIRERQVWDACLRIDLDSAPETSPPGDFELPTGLTIHETGTDMGYGLRLLDACSQNGPIVPAEVDGLRYPGRLPDDGPATSAPDPYFYALRQQFKNLIDDDVPESVLKSSGLPNMFETWLADVATTGFRRQVDTDDPPGDPLEFTPLLPGVTGGGLMSVEVFVAKNREQAVDVFVTLAASYAGVLKRCEPNLGDLALQDPGRAVLMLRGPIVTVMLGDRDQTDAQSGLAEAYRLDDALREFYEPPLPL